MLKYDSLLQAIRSTPGRQIYIYRTTKMLWHDRQRMLIIISFAESWMKSLCRSWEIGHCQKDWVLLLCTNLHQNQFPVNSLTDFPLGKSNVHLISRGINVFYIQAIFSLRLFLVLRQTSYPSLILLPSCIGSKLAISNIFLSLLIDLWLTLLSLCYLMEQKSLELWSILSLLTSVSDRKLIIQLAMKFNR